MIRTVATKASRRTSMAAATSGLRQVTGGGTSTSSAGGCHRHVRGEAWSLPLHRDATATSVRAASSLMSAGSTSSTLAADHRQADKSSGAVLTSRRYMGMYRRPHQRNLREDPSLGADVDFDDSNPALSADDMETYDFLSGGADFHPLDDDDDAFGTSRSEGDGGDDGADDDEDDEERIRQDLEEERKAQAIRDELDRRTGRGWTDDWSITEEDWFAGRKLDDLPDWSPELCSRMSLERVKVVDGKCIHLWAQTLQQKHAVGCKCTDLNVGRSSVCGFCHSKIFLHHLDTYNSSYLQLLRATIFFVVAE